jgi:Rieske Fe-S protein
MSAASPVPRPDTAPIVGPALRRRPQSAGATLSRRTLLRRSLGLGAAVWVTELLAGTVGFLWSAGASASSRVRVGSLQDLIARHPGLPIADGFPAYVVEARAFVVLVDPGRDAFLPGVDPTGDGTALNVRALSQVCPHLGCRPNPCVEDRWFHCPCHQSRYDRLGIKPAGTRFGPADRSMDRLAIEVDDRGVLTIDTRRVSLGPLPVALGQPGLEPPLVANGCT